MRIGRRHASMAKLRPNSSNAANATRSVWKTRLRLLAFMAWTAAWEEYNLGIACTLDPPIAGLFCPVSENSSREVAPDPRASKESSLFRTSGLIALFNLVGRLL